MSLLPCEVVEVGEDINASIIWLHGLGADGNDFKPIVPELRLPQDLGIRFIFPHAPSIPVTINNGYVMPAWYDILEMSIDRKVDDVQLRHSADRIRDFMKSEHEKGIPFERMIIAGFSQGGAVALELALSFPEKLGGLLAMSTYFATKESINWHEANQQLPIEIHHGLYDPIVPFALGQMNHQLLNAKGYSAHFESYPMEHAVCPQQISRISQWIQERLKD